MSYGAAAALQAAVYQRLTGYPALAGVSIVDAIPAGASPGSFVLIGPEVVTDQSDKSGAGAEHRFDISVISDATGFLSAKIIAAAVLDANLALGSGTLVSLRFQRAVARRIDQGDVRRIDLSFRARIEI
jgi:Ni,Fe-hydrogenase maturation factor